MVGVGHEVECFLARGVDKPSESTAREVGAVFVLTVVIFYSEIPAGCADDFFAVVAGALGDAGAVLQRGDGVELL